MSNYARLSIENVVIETFMESEEIKLRDVFPEALAMEFVQVPDVVCVNWKNASGAWSAPIVAAPDSLAAPKVDVMTFKFLFTMDELAKIYDARTGDSGLNLFWNIVDDPRTDMIDLAAAAVQSGIQKSLSVVKDHDPSLDLNARKEEILTGIVK